MENELFKVLKPDGVETGNKVEGVGVSAFCGDACDIFS